MNKTTAQAFLEMVPQLRIDAVAAKTQLGPVEYARYMHDIDTDAREATAVIRRAQFRIVEPA